MITETKELTEPFANDGDGLSLFHALPTSENGWSPRPFQIVSLLEMLEFNAPRFMKLLGRVEYCMAWAEQKDGNELIDDENRGALVNQLAEVVSECEALGLNIAATMVRDSKINLSLSERFRPNFRDVIEEARVVERVIKAELETCKFLLIPKSDACYYKAENLFGQDVTDNFADAAYDITEAGKCMATGRSTACVLHLMRVLEIGLNSLAGQFQVPFTHVNWNQVIDQIEARIKDIDKGQNKLVTWQEDRKFYSSAANQFRYFKDSWRNYAMHIHDKYTPEEALIVFTSVKVFMEQIAKKLKQP